MPKKYFEVTNFAPLLSALQALMVKGIVKGLVLLSWNPRDSLDFPPKGPAPQTHNFYNRDIQIISNYVREIKQYE